MEKLAREIDLFFQENLEQYNELAQVMRLESGYIVKMDVQSLWAASSRKKELAVAIEKLRQGLLSSLDAQGIVHGMDSRRFSSSRLLESLPLSAKTKSFLEKSRITIDILKDELKQIAESNRRNIQEYLGVIDGVISTVTGAAQHKSYSSNGNASASRSYYGSRVARPVSTTLISAQV